MHAILETCFLVVFRSLESSKLFKFSFLNFNVPHSKLACSLRSSTKHIMLSFLATGEVFTIDRSLFMSSDKQGKNIHEHERSLAPSSVKVFTSSCPREKESNLQDCMVLS